VGSRIRPSHALALPLRLARSFLDSRNRGISVRGWRDRSPAVRRIWRTGTCVLAVGPWASLELSRESKRTTWLDQSRESRRVCLWFRARRLRLSDQSAKPQAASAKPQAISTYPCGGNGGGADASKVCSSGMLSAATQFAMPCFHTNVLRDNEPSRSL